MSILSLYICQKLLTNFLLVATAMIGLVSIFVFIGELDAIKNNYGLAEAVNYTVMLIPGTLFHILPFICLVSVLLVLGNMSETNELIILRTCGFSVIKLSLFILSIIFYIGVIFVVLDSLAISQLSKYAATYKLTHKYPSKVSNSVDFWIRENNSIMYLSSVQKDGKIGLSYVYKFDDQRKIQQLQDSQSGSLQQKTLNFHQVDSTVISNETKVEKNFDSQVQLKTEYHLDFRQMEEFEPKNLSLPDLYDISRYQKKQKPGSNQYWAVLLGKLLLPFNICAMAFLSLTFVFGSTRSVSPASRVFLGIMVGLLFYFINELSVPLHLALGIPALVTVVAPGILAVILGLSVKKISRS